MIFQILTSGSTQTDTEWDSAWCSGPVRFIQNISLHAQVKFVQVHPQEDERYRYILSLTLDSW